MTNTNEPATPSRRRNWWGWNPGGGAGAGAGAGGWDDQGCLGCGLAWWIAALCAIIIFGFWGWGVPGWGGWGGWGWRHNQGSAQNCPPGGGGGAGGEPGVGRTNVQGPNNAAPSGGGAGGAGGGAGGGTGGGGQGSGSGTSGAPQ